MRFKNVKTREPKDVRIYRSIIVLWIFEDLKIKDERGRCDEENTFVGCLNYLTTDRYIRKRHYRRHSYARSYRGNLAHFIPRRLVSANLSVELWHAMVIEERLRRMRIGMGPAPPFDLAHPSSRWDACRAAAKFRRFRAGSIWHESRSARTMTWARAVAQFFSMRRAMTAGAGPQL